MAPGEVSACQRQEPHWNAAAVAVVEVGTGLEGNSLASAGWDIHLGGGSDFVECLEPFLATCLVECSPFDSSCFLVAFFVLDLKLDRKNAEGGREVSFERAGD